MRQWLFVRENCGVLRGVGVKANETAENICDFKRDLIPYGGD